MANAIDFKQAAIVITFSIFVQAFQAFGETSREDQGPVITVTSPANTSVTSPVMIRGNGSLRVTATVNDPSPGDVLRGDDLRVLVYRIKREGKVLIDVLRLGDVRGKDYEYYQFGVSGGEFGLMKSGDEIAFSYLAYTGAGLVNGGVYEFQLTGIRDRAGNLSEFSPSTSVFMKLFYN